MAACVYVPYMCIGVEGKSGGKKDTLSFPLTMAADYIRNTNGVK